MLRAGAERVICDGCRQLSKLSFQASSFAPAASLALLPCLGGPPGPPLQPRGARGGNRAVVSALRSGLTSQKNLPSQLLGPLAGCSAPLCPCLPLQGCLAPSLALRAGQGVPRSLLRGENRLGIPEKLTVCHTLSNNFRLSWLQTMTETAAAAPAAEPTVAEAPAAPVEEVKAPAAKKTAAKKGTKVGAKRKSAGTKKTPSEHATCAGCLARACLCM